MKKLFHLSSEGGAILLLALCAFCLMPTNAWAYGNDYLEKQNHYSVTATGQDVIHFVIPMYSWYNTTTKDYYVHKMSYIYIDNITDESGSKTIAKMYTKRSADDAENNTHGNGKGSAYLEMKMGKAIVTSTYNGINQLVDQGKESGKMIVKEEEDESTKVSKLEFDWYPPTELNGKKFRINLRIYLYANQSDPKDNNSAYDFDWHFDNSGQNFTTNDNVMAPMLMDPYLYTTNESGVAGYGAAIVPFMTYQTAFNYTTSLAPGKEWPVSNKERAGMIQVPTTDTVQPDFYATFTQERNATTHEKISVKSNTVKIPPYHRIYDFEATAETDETGTFTGNHILTWNIKNSHLTDLMDGDMFEIERALKPDFSDARQVTITSMSRNKSSYSFVDNSRDTWTGNNNAQADTFSFYTSYTPNSAYVINDQNGNAKYSVELELINDKVLVSSVPVYYRIRRASASIWGWNNELVKTTQLNNVNYLAPLAAAQENYTKDAGFDTNHKVNFRFKIENSDIPPISFPNDGFKLNVKKVNNLSDSVTVRIIDVPERKTDLHSMKVLYQGETIISEDNYQFHGNREFKVPRGATIYFSMGLGRDDLCVVLNESHLFQVMLPLLSNRFSYIVDKGVISEKISLSTEQRQHLIDSLSPLIVAKYQQQYDGGKCMWDNSAKLIVTRTIEETGQRMEFIIPSDSIRRQSDGSWIATYSDIADRACSHYSYSVRIDQSTADLHVFDSLQLQPITISGPELYFDESATITRFTATQGDASTAMKNGVQLRWQVNSNAVDEYILTRIRKGSDASPDTIYRGDNSDFFDRSAVPDVHYDYTIATHYSCNGKSTSNSATTEGWRTPYGEISGAINMSDNSGMAGVEVALQDTAGTTLRRMTTDGTGFFLFDSLTYDATKGGVFIVVPTAQYGTFSYNSTSASTAAVTLSSAEAVGNGIDFANTSSTRLSGRVLYKMSTIPVPGVMFLLNGDTLRRGNTPVTTGTDGNFELILPTSQPCKLQVFKPGHTFEGDGILHVEQGQDTFALTKPLDGVRFYDQTKVRLVGRVAGGNDQRDLKHGFGLGKNNLGDNLQLVLMLEGDNTAQIVHDPDDMSRDTINQSVSYASINDGQVVTNTRFEKKRIVLRPDSATGEFAVDLFPVKYKVVQATATGYATLFAQGQGSETFDLVNAPLKQITDSLNGKKVVYNAVYDRIYHNPVVIGLNQVLYGVERKGYGESEMEFSSLNPVATDKVSMYTEQPDGTINYLMGHPVFISNRRYQFVARAYEEYVYNNNRSIGIVDRVPQRGGEVIIHNGLHSQTDTLHFTLNEKGENRAVWLSVDQIDTRNSGTNALRTVSTLLKTEGTAVETSVFQAYVSGVDYQSGDITATESEVVLLDIIRDPAGMGSSAWVDAGSTYSFSYTETYAWSAGVEIDVMRGLNFSQDIGTVSAPMGAGTYLGSNFETTRLLTIPIPINHEWNWGYNYMYSVTTSNNISTSMGITPADVGSLADVFYGTTVSQLAGKVNAVAVISDSLYQVRMPAIAAGMMKVLGQGTTADGKNYYLVTGQKTVLGSKVNNTFIYTQDYIINTLIPKLALERANLLMDFPDSTSAQSYADGTGEPVYWRYNTSAMAGVTDTLPKGTYKMIIPNDNKVYTNRVAALDNMIREWVAILYANEKEKVNARMGGSSKEVGTWSIAAGASLSHTDSYTGDAGYNELPQSAKLWGQSAASDGISTASTLLMDWKSIAGFFALSKGDKIGETVGSAISKIGDLTEAQGTPGSAEHKENIQQMGSRTNTTKWNFDFTPIANYMSDFNISRDRDVSKSTGFSLSADNMGDLTVAVYRARTDSIWRDTTAIMRNKTGVTDENMLYGSYVFYTVGGSTYCPHEEEERTRFYNPGTIINNGTQWVSKPELSIDTYEQSAVMPDKRAVFHVTMMNNAPVQAGRAALGNQFDLSLVTTSNPNGARITMDGQPLTQSMGFWLTPGVPVTKTLEVERGTVDDYENLSLSLGLADCPITFTTLNFSVHFLPVSSPVEITSPRQNWTMNTLSPRDSIGYYLPIEIDGFDIHHKNFDHIEFQYKLSTQSDDDWVNQCSFYADDSLYQLASGNKAMIENGRIVPFRFYGERDPKELNYDLRAVTFCRFGSGFVTKSSTVISGVKDTRPPVVFGDPEPANGILGIGEHLYLRFSEPIAGNWLDEDNNFQLVGITNETSPTTDASPHFDGSQQSYAASAVNRSLSGHSFSIDMMVKPNDPNAAVTFFTHGLDGNGLSFGRTADNRLLLRTASTTIYSKPLPDKMLEFTRVVVTYDHETKVVRFFAGTKEVTDSANLHLPEPYNLSAPLAFGRGLEGNILETRVWTKALTPEEVSATNLRYLTGYERELMAYYRMNEGSGTTLRDRASGATLSMQNTSWNLPKGLSLAINKTDSINLARNVLSRSAVYDGTYMLWFRPTSTNGTIFTVGDKRFALQDGKLIFRYGDADQIISGQIGTNTWHHLVLVINRTYNNVAVYLDNQMAVTFAADRLSGMVGDMFFGGNGFEGNIDEFVVFEQALPKAFIAEFGNRTPLGDEMGLMAYLPFEQQVQNANGVLEQVFSINDQRIFRDPNGNVVNKAVPLVTDSIVNGKAITALADKTSYAPVSGMGLLSKLNFNWTYNNEELLINLKMADYEVNHQPVFVTVRDVEDLNGNPMPSPVMWMATVDRNALRWYDNELVHEWLYSNDRSLDYENNVEFAFFNQTGLRHQFAIESLPDWLTVSDSYGSISAISDKTIRFYFNPELPVGTYSDYIYLTDENGLSEPLRIEYTVAAICPWEDVKQDKYDNSMSLRAQVRFHEQSGNALDVDPNDVVAVFCQGELVGKANITYDNNAGTSYVYLTVYGNSNMIDKLLTFKLWQASTGKTFVLSPATAQRYQNNAIRGYAPNTPVMLNVNIGAAAQQIDLNKGWNWISLNLNPSSTALDELFSYDKGFRAGDIVKSASERQFSNFVETDSTVGWRGTLLQINYPSMYMMRVAEDRTLDVEGTPLTDEQRVVTLNNGWNCIAYLLDEPMPVREALADYYDKATIGDVVKSKDAVAVFSENGKWEGSLQTMRPGQGYLFLRLAGETTTMRYILTPSGYNAPGRDRSKDMPFFTNPAASANMTLVAALPETEGLQEVEVYVQDELAAVAAPQVIDGDTLYFITVQSDHVGQPLTFRTADGEYLTVQPQADQMAYGQIANEPNAHYGTLRKPVLLVPTTDKVYKIIENNHIVIIKNNEKYDVTGRKL